jgi:lipopolysaccharide/colanic/teichoic acid biosynthesis glycosyltransferase
MAKRLIDFCGALLGVVLLSPILFILAFLIRFDSPGPVFYRGVRVGRFGKPFRMFKFRTMVANAEQIGGASSATDDVRITRVGRFLRRYKLDELPQLINVLRGEMSLVGPRPEVLQYVAMFSAEEKVILSVAPGITDWASVWNRDEGKLLAGSHDPEKVYLEQIRPEKIRLQLEYVRNQSLSNDIRILLATFKVLLFGRLEAAVLQERSHDAQR